MLQCESIHWDNFSSHSPKQGECLFSSRHQLPIVPSPMRGALEPFLLYGRTFNWLELVQVPTVAKVMWAIATSCHFMLIKGTITKQRWQIETCTLNTIASNCLKQILLDLQTTIKPNALTVLTSIPDLKHFVNRCLNSQVIILQLFLASENWRDNKHESVTTHDLRVTLK